MPDMIEHAASDAGYTIAHGDPATAMLAFGMKYATGEEGAPDLVAAHKWFNRTRTVTTRAQLLAVGGLPGQLR